MRMVVACFWVVLPWLGCSSHQCTEIGCVESAGVKLRPAGGSWTAGEYRVDLVVDGTPHACTTAVSADLETLPNGGRPLDCEPALDALLVNEQRCTETTTGDTVTHSCEPVPQKFAIEVLLDGTPASVDLTVARDGRTLSTESLRIPYRDEEINGPGCGTCRTGHVEVEF